MGGLSDGAAHRLSRCRRRVLLPARQALRELHRRLAPSPRGLRRDLTRVYAFCRFTDDLGDESGDRVVAMRRLRRWRDETHESFAYDERTHPVLVALADTVERFGWMLSPSSI